MHIHMHVFGADMDTWLERATPKTLLTDRCKTLQAKNKVGLAMDLQAVLN